MISWGRALMWFFIGASALFVWVLWPRTPEVPQDRPIGPVTAGKGIVVLGTSLSHKDWPQALGADLTACGGDPGPITQITRPGADARWGIAQLDRVIAANPGLVLVEFAINDADFLDGLSRTASREALVTIIQTLQQNLSGAQIAVMTMNPVTGIKRLQRPFLSEYYTIVREEAEAQGVGLIDLEPRWALAFLKGVAGLPDGLHPQSADVGVVALPAITRSVAEGLGLSGC